MTSPPVTDLPQLARRLGTALDRIEAGLAAEAAQKARLQRIEAAASETLASLDALLAADARPAEG
jgi:hypothetical protein